MDRGTGDARGILGKRSTASFGMFNTRNARARGVVVLAAHSAYGYTGYFSARFHGTNARFDGLPVALFTRTKCNVSVQSKKETKEHLVRGGFPVAPGKTFWWWQTRVAILYGAHQLGFPLVVKPLSGSVARHITTNITNVDELRMAIKKAVAYGPAYMIERFIDHASVFRVTVVDDIYVACARQIPAHVVGDGDASVRALVEKKNNVRMEKTANEMGRLFYPLKIDGSTEKLLAELGHTMDTVPRLEESVYVQRDPFLKLGGDIIEVTETMHPDNRDLCQRIAKFFDLRLVGIDVMMNDITRSWKEQRCAVLELNDLPCIEMHQFPSLGKPQNIAAPVVDLLFKYYV